MLVRELMTAPAVTAPPALSLPDAAHLMKTRGIRRLPVVDESGVLVGIVTDRDLREALPSKLSTLSPWEATTRLAAVKLADIMRRSVLTVDEDADARDAAYTMLHHRIGALPVVNGRGELTGLLTVTDVLRDYARTPEGQAMPSTNSQEPA